MPEVGNTFFTSLLTNRESKQMSNIKKIVYDNIKRTLISLYFNLTFLFN